jgi:hypothetical protein
MSKLDNSRHSAQILGDIVDETQEEKIFDGYHNAGVIVFL